MTLFFKQQVVHFYSAFWCIFIPLLTRPREIDLYEAFCGVLYVLKSGCQWRMIPKEFPKWRTCHYYFSCWSAKRPGMTHTPLEEVLKKISCRNKTC